MWYLMENAQRSYTLSERLLRAIGVGHHTAPGTRSEQEDIEELIRQGADVNQSHGTFLPLHCACMVGDATSVAVLLKWGADVNRYDGYHRTALHHAVERSPQCTSLLLAAGADTESVDVNRDTPLHWAAFRNRADCCRLLLEHQAHVDSLDFNHDTPLSWAAMKFRCARPSLDTRRALGLPCTTARLELRHPQKPIRACGCQSVSPASGLVMAPRSSRSICTMRNCHAYGKTIAMFMAGLKCVLTLVCSSLAMLRGADWLCPAPA
ncbi:uncharacterized protein LOC142568002 isoform X2 [Dermacentor variabilis]|uniref:uncharacterized protein LOC142568002 isoform X2 n=1 Tax=Dermacentor variabilis TaxID=34621 RepID=UPI003F5CA891